MNEILSIADLHLRFKIDSFVQKTIEQLNKDLALAGLDWQFQLTDKSEIPQIIEGLNQKFRELSVSQNQALNQLLYTIDLPEDLFTSDENLAELILRREAYKVYLREKFSTS